MHIPTSRLFPSSINQWSTGEMERSLPIHLRRETRFRRCWWLITRQGQGSISQVLTRQGISSSAISVYCHPPRTPCGSTPATNFTPGSRIIFKPLTGTDRRELHRSYSGSKEQTRFCLYYSVIVKDAKRLAHDWILENLAGLP